MSLFSSPDLERLRSEPRSIQLTFMAIVGAPVGGLVLLWGLVAHFLPGGAGGFLLSLFAAALIVVAAGALAKRFTQGVSRDVGAVETAARTLADEHLSELTEQVRREELLGMVAELARSGPFTTETGRAEAAVIRLLQRAHAAAEVEVKSRDNLGKVFMSLARRNQSLLQRQLRLIDALEQKASDPATLADLFRLDHLTTRMRRHAENLIILSGAAPGRSWSEPVPVVDVIRAAVAEVEDYTRVAVLTVSEDAVAGSAAADLIHLLAELIENGTFFSPSEMRVEIRAQRVTNGFAIEVDDRGLGIKAAQLGQINEHLANPPDFDLANTDQLGLFVVGRLAARHGARVSLRPSPYGGITAVVLLPGSLVVPVAPTEAGLRESRPAIESAVEQRQADSLTLTGPRPVLVGLPSAAPAEQRHAEAGAPAPAPAVAPEDPAEDSGTYRGLPRRVRQANLSPRLRESPDLAGRAAAASRTGPAEDRSPEGTRDLVASLQRGWQRGRAQDAPEGDGAAAAEAAGQRGAQTVSDEEK